MSGFSPLPPFPVWVEVVKSTPEPKHADRFHPSDHFKGGSFATTSTIPSSQSIEAFYKTQMIARTINSKWRTSRVFIMFTQTLNENDVSGPNQTKYYSKEDSGVYYLYQYV